MSDSTPQAEWYYVGQYGELGPLSLDQMKDLIQDKVVDGDTYVWRTGMADWVQANTVSELRARIAANMTTPPPPPPGSIGRPPAPAAPRAGAYQSPAPGPAAQPVQAPLPYHMSRAEWQSLEATLPRSDKKRITAGLLCLIPGAGRLYLGYSAHGVLQLVTFLLCGVGLIWSWIDCFWILLGGEKFDGYGRVLQD